MESRVLPGLGFCLEAGWWGLEGREGGEILVGILRGEGVRGVW